MRMASTSAHYKKWKSGYKPSTKITVQNQLDVLRRRVSRNTPEVQYHQDLFAFTPLTNLSNQYERSFTASLIGSAGFRSAITGDQWYNKTLRFRFDPSTTTGTVRLAFYIPKKAGQRFTPATASNPPIRFPDPTAFRILYDRTWDPSKEGSLYASGKISLGNLLTSYNSDSNTLERGELMCVVWTTGSLGKTMALATEIAFANK